VPERAKWRKATQRRSIQLRTAAPLGDFVARRTGGADDTHACGQRRTTVGNETGVDIDGDDLDSGSVARVAAVACRGGRGVGAVPAAPASQKAMRGTRRMVGNHTDPADEEDGV
jgi:hypothetical protein